MQEEKRAEARFFWGEIEYVRLAKVTNLGKHFKNMGQK